MRTGEVRLAAAGRQDALELQVQRPQPRRQQGVQRRQAARRGRVMQPASVDMTIRFVYLNSPAPVHSGAMCAAAVTGDLNAGARQQSPHRAPCISAPASMVVHRSGSRSRRKRVAPQRQRLEAACALLQPPAQLCPPQPAAHLAQMLLGVHLDLRSADLGYSLGCLVSVRIVCSQLALGWWELHIRLCSGRKQDTTSARSCVRPVHMRLSSPAATARWVRQKQPPSSCRPSAAPRACGAALASVRRAKAKLTMHDQLYMRSDQ